MNKVGIGQFKHAKPAKTAKKTVAKSNESLQDKARRLQNTPKATTSTSSNSSTQKKTSTAKLPKEGQLAVDVLQTGTEMLIICPIAGVKKSEIKVAIQDDVLTIRGERMPLKELEDKTPLVRELFWGNFSRSIVLPDHIDRKNIQARVHEHLLIITIPKTEDFKTRIIHIND